MVQWFDLSNKTVSNAQHPSLPFSRGECSIISFGFVTHRYISFDNPPQVRIVLLVIDCLPVVQHRCEGWLIRMLAQRQVGHCFPEALLVHSSNGPDTHADVGGSSESSLHSASHSPYHHQQGLVQLEL